jgi:hypothetical protein
MWTASRSALILVTALAFAPGADAQPTPCRGRYTIDGSVDVGAPTGVVRTLTAGRRIAINGGDDAFTVGLGDCSAAVVTQAPRTDAFVLRSRFRGCGERPRFRLRLVFAPDCRSLTARRRSQGRLLNEFTAQLTSFPNPGGPGTPIGTGPLDPGAPSNPGTPGNPGAPNTTPIGTTPTISVVQPQAARPGDTISVFGRNLDRDSAGVPWSGTPPYVARMLTRGFGTRRASVTVTFRSATELQVVVPARAVTGTIILAQLNPDGTTGATISETAEDLVIIRDDTTPPPPPVTGTPPSSANTATVIVQGTQLDAIQPGTYPLSGAAFSAGAFLDLNRNFFVDLIDPSGQMKNVPYLAFPVRTSDIDFSITPGSGYFAGADAMLWFVLGDVAPGVAGGDVFVTVHLDVDIARGTARPIAIIAGIAQESRIVLSTDVSGFSTFDFQVDSPVVGGPGAIRGHLAAVPTFLENLFIPSQPGLCLDPDFFCPDFGPSIQQNLWANGIDITFDLPLFNDN